jgi:hypothetical protein
VQQETVEQFEQPQKREDITPTGKPEVIPAESQQIAEETDSVVSPVTHPPKTGEYIVMECTGFQCCTHENPATAEYPLWSYENMNATIGNDVEKNVTAEFLYTSGRSTIDHSFGSTISLQARTSVATLLLHTT